MADGHIKVTRDDWLNAARAALIADGVDAVKVLALAIELDVSRSSFYWYFKNRDELLAALLDHWEERNTQSIVRQCALEAGCISEGACTFFRCFIDPRLFDRGLDFAVRAWARQGVLLLNSSLTVPAGDANGHKRLGWSQLTEQVLTELSNKPRAFILWGKHAQGFAPHITGPDHLILKTPHPSPLSARRGFFGSRPFSKVNAWLKAKGDTEIDWTLQ